MLPTKGESLLREKTEPIQENLNVDFYRNMLNSIKDYAVFTIDKKGYVNSWNFGAQNLLGYKQEEIIGQHFSILFTDEDLKASADKKELKEALKTGRGVDERYHVCKNKSQFFSSGLVFPIYNEARKVTGFTKVMRNVDERMMAEEQARGSKNYAQSIVETAREPMLVLNKDFSVNTANEAFYTIFNVKGKLSAAKPFYELFPGQWDLLQIKLLLNKIVADEEAVKDYEIVQDFKNLGKRILLLNGRKILDPASRTDLILVSIEDVTEKRSAEQQKDDFISIAGHEIKTPITVIKAQAQMLQKRSQKFGDEAFTQSLGKIDEKTDKLIALINYLLDITQIETGEMQLVKADFDLETLVAESVEEKRIVDTNHKFVLQGSCTATVFADRFRISQVLNNLLNNAAKYSPADSEINIKLTKSSNKDYIVISVKDFGMGVPEEEQGHLFRRFSRSSNVKNMNIGGLGLGLHISKEIVKQHNGKIWFKSEAGKGSTFYFRIPVKV
jgi:PAS domain S-box-containing protein